MSLDTLEVEVHLIIRNKETQAHAPALVAVLRVFVKG